MPILYILCIPSSKVSFHLNIDNSYIIFCFYLFQSLPFTKIAHSITAQDHQPTPDSCIMSMVVGQLKVSTFSLNLVLVSDSYGIAAMLEVNSFGKYVCVKGLKGYSCPFEMHNITLIPVAFKWRAAVEGFILS